MIPDAIKTEQIVMLKSQQVSCNGVNGQVETQEAKEGLHQSILMVKTQFEHTPDHDQEVQVKVETATDALEVSQMIEGSKL